MEDAVARRRVVRLLDAVQPRELAADRRLLVVGVAAGEDEVIVGDRRLARIDRVAAGDLVEGVDRERRGAVGGRQQVGVDAQRRAGLEVRRLSVLVDAVRPDDLLGRRHARAPRRRSGQSIDGAVVDRRRGTRAGRPRRCRRCGGSPLPSATAAPARSVLPCVSFASARVTGIEGELVAVLRVGDGLGALHDVQAEVEARCAGRCRPCCGRRRRPSRRPASSATPLRPAGLISRDEPIANRSPAMTKVSPRWTRARKSGIR